jgi:hypothetical protein
MALQRDTAGNTLCSHCEAQLETYTGFGALLAGMFLMDIATLILAAVFVAIGLLWTPAYIVAACIVVVGMILALRNHKQAELSAGNVAGSSRAKGLKLDAI